MTSATNTSSWGGLNMSGSFNFSTTLAGSGSLSASAGAQNLAGSSSASAGGTVKEHLALKRTISDKQELHPGRFLCYYCKPEHTFLLDQVMQGNVGVSTPIAIHCEFCTAVRPGFSLRASFVNGQRVDRYRETFEMLKNAFEQLCQKKRALNIRVSGNVMEPNPRIGAFEVVLKWTRGWLCYEVVLFSKLNRRSFPNIHELVTYVAKTLEGVRVHEPRPPPQETPRNLLRNTAPAALDTSLAWERPSSPPASPRLWFEVSSRAHAPASRRGTPSASGSRSGGGRQQRAGGMESGVVVTVQHAGAVELKSSFEQRAAHTFEQLPKLSSPYPAPIPPTSPLFRPQSFARVVVFRLSRITPLRIRRSLHTFSRPLALAHANSWPQERLAPWGGSLEALLPPRAPAEASVQEGEEEGEEPWELQRRCRCAEARSERRQRGGGEGGERECSAEAGCVLRGTWLTLQAGRLSVATSQRPRSRPRGQSWWVEADGAGGQSGAGGRPLWAALASKCLREAAPRERRPALVRYRCSCCRACRPPSAFSLEGVAGAPEQALCRSCAQGAAPPRHPPVAQRPSALKRAASAPWQAAAEGEAVAVVEAGQLQGEAGAVYGREEALLRRRIRRTATLTLYLSLPPQGLEAERAALRGALRGLRRTCERRGTGLRVLELRGGLEGGEGAEGSERGLAVRLAAIEESDLFLGVYGESYGSTAADGGEDGAGMHRNLERCYRDHRFEWVLGHPPLLADGRTTAKSVQHLEMELGVGDTHRRRAGEGGEGSEEGSAGPLLAALFFRRSPEPQHHLGPAHHTLPLLRAMRGEAEARGRAGHGAVWEFASAEGLARAAAAHLHALLLGVLPPRRWASAVDAGQEALARALGVVSYVQAAESPQAAAALRAYLLRADGPRRPLVLTGAAGTGKSSLVARMVAEASSRPRTSVAFHLLAASPADASPRSALQSLTRQVVALLRLRDAAAAEQQVQQLPLEQQLGALLRLWADMSAPSHALLLAIDAVDETAPHGEQSGGAEQLEWLRGEGGWELPEGVKVLLSVGSEGRGQGWVEAAESAGFEVVRLGEMEEERVEALVEGRLAGSLRQSAPWSLGLDAPAIRRIASTPARANPLYVSLLTAELLQPQPARAEALLEAEAAEELVMLLLARLEALHPPPRLAHPVRLGTVLQAAPFVDTQPSAPPHRRSLDTTDLFALVVNLRPEPAAALEQGRASKSGLPQGYSAAGCQCGSRVQLSGVGGEELVVERVLSPQSLVVAAGRSQLRAAAPKLSGSLTLTRPSMLSRLLRLLWASGEGLEHRHLRALLNMQLRAHRLRLHLNRAPTDPAAYGEAAALSFGMSVEVDASAAAAAGESEGVEGAGTRGGVVLASRDGKALVLVEGQEEWVEAERVRVVEGGGVEQEHLLPLLAGLGALVGREGGRLRLAHGAVRRAVEQRYLGCECLSWGAVTRADVQRALHDLLADFLYYHAPTRPAPQHSPAREREIELQRELAGRRRCCGVTVRVRAGMAASSEDGEWDGDEALSVHESGLALDGGEDGQRETVTLGWESACLGSGAEQSEVWESVEGDWLVAEALKGGDALVLAVGERGSGKSSSMWGRDERAIRSAGPAAAAEECGVIGRVVAGLVAGVQGQAGWWLEVGALEVEGESARDLLGRRREPFCVLFGSQSPADAPPLAEEGEEEGEEAAQVRVLWAEGAGQQVRGQRWRRVPAAEGLGAALPLIRELYRARSRPSRPAASASLRPSHCVVTLRLCFAPSLRRASPAARSVSPTRSPSAAGGGGVRATVTLVDTAGFDAGRRASRQQHSPSASGERWLLALERVVDALGRGAEVVPYRQSLLTRLLAPALVPTCLTTAIVTVNPELRHLPATRRALRLARALAAIPSTARRNASPLSLPPRLRPRFSPKSLEPPGKAAQPPPSSGSNGHAQQPPAGQEEVRGQQQAAAQAEGAREEAAPPRALIATLSKPVPLPPPRPASDGPSSPLVSCSPRSSQDSARLQPLTTPSRRDSASRLRPLPPPADG